MVPPLKPVLGFDLRRARKALPQPLRVSAAEEASRARPAQPQPPVFTRRNAASTTFPDSVSGRL